jgi:hypothetical protein
MAFTIYTSHLIKLEISIVRRAKGGGGGGRAREIRFVIYGCQ